MKYFESGSGTVARYTEEDEIERAVDAHLRAIDGENETVPHLLSGLDDSATLREASLNHLSHEYEMIGEVGDDRVEEVVHGYSSADSKWDTPDLDDGVE